jgi:DNA polymerase III subunit beta
MRGAYGSLPPIFELGITCWIPARIDENGSTTVPSRTFQRSGQYLAERSGAVDPRCENANLHVKGGTSNNDIKCIDAQEFPPHAHA